MPSVFRRGALVAACALAICAFAFRSPAFAAETNEFRVTKQPSVLYLQQVIMEERKLIEKHAAGLGMPDLKVSWVTITSGGVSTEALLSGSVDMVTSGISNMLLLYSRSNGAVKSVAGVAGLPSLLVTRNPKIKTLKDFGPEDRIAVPTIRVSMQSMMLGMALEQTFGQGAFNRLDSNQVQLGHPDATQAVLNPTHEVASHFSAPPFQEIALKSPNVHTVLKSTDALGGPATTTNTFTTVKFHDANPIKIKAYLAALDEASEMVAKNPRGAAEIYLAATKEKMTPDELAALITQPGAIFSATPQRTMVYADYMARIGLIKPKPASWKDYFFDDVHDRPGS